MRVLLTGSSGRIGRAIYAALLPKHQVIGLDRNPFATTSLIGDVGDPALLRRAIQGVDAVIHTAALHAPHVGHVAEAEFRRVNVDAVARLLELALQYGVRTVVLTSTTALYGHAVRPGACTWLTEASTPLPRTIYHRTKLQAEGLLQAAASARLATRVVRMSRCFPESVDKMAVYRLHRGIDVRDVAAAHLAVLQAQGPIFQRYIASASTPFQREDVEQLAEDPAGVLQRRCPGLWRELQARGWRCPAGIDRVYDPQGIEQALGWRSRHGYEDVLADWRRDSLEVLPLPLSQACG